MKTLPGKYKAILADPPWTFATYSRKGKGRSAEAHYDCMSMHDIKTLPVAQWANDDCVLFIWTTDPMLPQALNVIAAWGFEYKTVAFTWAKAPRHWQAPLISIAELPIGTGYWTRANPEMCLLATRGAPKRISRSVRQLIVAPRREHSRKPDEIYGRIEALCEGPYLELFTRFPQNGWDSFGLKTGIEPRRWKSNSHPNVAQMESQ